MSRITSFMKYSLIVLFFIAYSCVEKRRSVAVHPTTDKPGYCYYSDGYWYIYYLNASGNYTYAGSSTSFDSYSPTEVDWSPSPTSVSNYSESPATEIGSMSETSGEATGGSESATEASGGMSESSGESSGGSDSGGDSGGGDSGGGDGGGGE